MWATAYFTGLCFHVPLSESLEEAISYRTTKAGHLCKDLCLKNFGQTFFFSSFFFDRRLLFWIQGSCCTILKQNERENCSYVDDRGVFILERDGSIVGDVCGDDACSFSHLVTGDVQLTHLSQALQLQRAEVSCRCSSPSPQEDSSQVSLHDWSSLS